MKNYSHKSSKKKIHSKNKSKSTSKAPSSRNSKSSFNFKLSSFKINSTKLKYIETIQRNWRKYFKRNIQNKIIKIQSIYKGYNIKKIFNDILILNKKLECFFFIIKITMFRHGINYDYLANKRIDYYSDHKKTKHFLLLQRRIKYYLFMKKIKILENLGIFEDIYIKTIEYRTKIKSKISEDKYYGKPIYKYNVPISQIIMIQNNFRIHLKYIKKLPRHHIDKLSLNKCPLITKEVKSIKIKNEDIYKYVRMKPINNTKDFYKKVNYKYTSLLLIQREYKKRYKYLKENYKLKKHSKIRRTIINKHHYIYHATVMNELEKVLLIQKNIKYFLYRKHSIINLIPKIKIPKCEIVKSYGFREYINKYFYEYFANKLFYIIKKFFLSIYLNELRKNYKSMAVKKIRKNSAFSKIDLNNMSLKNQIGFNFTNKEKLFKRKETFNLSPSQGLKQISNVPRYSNLSNNSDISKGNKKKVTFKDEGKFFNRDTKILIPKGGIYSVENETSVKSSKSSNEMTRSPHKRGTSMPNRSMSFNKKKK